MFIHWTQIWQGKIIPQLDFLQLESQLLTDKLPVSEEDPGGHTCPWEQDIAATIYWVTRSMYADNICMHVDAPIPTGTIIAHAYAQTLEARNHIH